MAKQVVTSAHVLIYKATEKAQSFVKEARTGGPNAAFNYAATEYKCFVWGRKLPPWLQTCLVTDMSQMGYSSLVFFQWPLLMILWRLVRTKKGEDTATVDGNKEEATAPTDGNIV
ncbi:PREDICTED: REF/SRPP-like protein At1g67360 [Camelina sativa]|uniref:REF/SRPP-like protein At1g67360 n=1 Tax=Camelina sativa TaxID=90675 RepID=A0ABM0WPH2_CAMSA|nr:PREDICTED: REF/SRPP-like protein At1g67360 [Camelina sativa]